MKQGTATQSLPLVKAPGPWLLALETCLQSNYAFMTPKQSTGIWPALWQSSCHIHRNTGPAWVLACAQCSTCSAHHSSNTMAYPFLQWHHMD
jgi:hypothetical protein